MGSHHSAHRTCVGTALPPPFPIPALASVGLQNPVATSSMESSLLFSFGSTASPQSSLRWGLPSLSCRNHGLPALPCPDCAL